MSRSSRAIGNLLGGRCDLCTDEDIALDLALNIEDMGGATHCHTAILDGQKYSMENNVASHSTTSSTSTESSDSLEKYRHKVQKLCLELGLAATHLEELGCGGYNRVVAIDCDSSNGSPAQARYVLRVPSAPTECSPELPESASLKNQVAMLKLLSTRTPLKIATVVSFDASYLNPLGSEYML